MRDKDWLQKQRQKAGVSVEGTPEVRQEFMWIWLGFCYLSARRLNFQGQSQSIQMSEIESYYRFKRLPTDWRSDMFLRVIDKLDSRYMEVMHERAKKDQQRKMGAGQGRGGRVR